MADDSYIGQVLNWLHGSQPPTVNTAPPLSSYPSRDDADYARHYGFSNGNEQQGYLDNQKARVLGYTSPETKMFKPASGVGLGIAEAINPAINQVVTPSAAGVPDNTMMRAALAANRSPIAALGFDPDKVVLDTQTKRPTFGGAYVPSKDTIYSATNPDDSVVHESTHRGLEKLREQFPEARSLLSSPNSPDEETVVRWLMKNQAGDPEGNQGPIDAKQRQFAIDTYGMPYTDYKGNLDKLQELAIQAMKDRGKRVGPQ